MFIFIYCTHNYFYFIHVHTVHLHSDNNREPEKKDISFGGFLCSDCTDRTLEWNMFALKKEQTDFLMLFLYKIKTDTRWFS